VFNIEQIKIVIHRGCRWRVASSSVDCSLPRNHLHFMNL